MTVNGGPPAPQPTGRPGVTAHGPGPSRGTPGSPAAPTSTHSAPAAPTSTHSAPGAPIDTPRTPSGLDAARRTVRAVRRRERARSLAVTTVLGAVVLAAFCATVAYGDMVVPLGELLATLTGGGGSGARFVVLELRLPRALLAILVGVAFGLSGAVFQALLRNPLASPDVIGISAGASAAALTCSVLFAVSGFTLSLAALAGAVGTAALIYALAWRRGLAGYRLVLVGIGVAAGFSALISYLLTSSRVTEAQSALLWLTGSLNGRSWEQVWPLLGALALLLPLTASAARHLRALQLGDATAGGLGARVESARLALLGCAVALAGVATAAAGPVAFVAFVSAPIARRLVPGDSAPLLPAALTGALVMLVADFVAQHALGAAQLPVGVATSVIGAPFLLWLLARANRAGAIR